MNTRTLKIESVGDFFNGKVSPKIRLSGRWLERAGFKPGCRVEVRNTEPGKLTLHLMGQSSPLALRPTPGQNPECPHLIQGGDFSSVRPTQRVSGLKQINYRTTAQSFSEAK